MRDGSLERIFRKWDVWNDDQPPLHARVLAGDPLAPYIGLELTSDAARESMWDAALRYLPALLRASVVTLVLSVSGDGAGRHARRADRDRPGVRQQRSLRAALLGYVELMRGTPVLLQLFVLYYGLAAAIRLPAFVAALLGLALNYAAYESEIYRAALEAVPKGQLEAGRVLGFERAAGARLVRAPQAFRLRAGADDERLRRAPQGFVAGVRADGAWSSPSRRRSSRPTSAAG